MAKILSVEDDSDLQYLYSMMLARRGHTIETAESTADAIALLSHRIYDLVLLDMNMPDVPGTRVIEFVRNSAHLGHLPIIVVSANNQRQQQAIDLGIKDFLTKPVTLQELVSTVDAALAGEQT